MRTRNSLRRRWPRPDRTIIQNPAGKRLGFVFYGVLIQLLGTQKKRATRPQETASLMGGPDKPEQAQMHWIEAVEGPSNARNACVDL